MNVLIIHVIMFKIMTYAFRMNNAIIANNASLKHVSLLHYHIQLINNVFNIKIPAL